MNKSEVENIKENKDEKKSFLQKVKNLIEKVKNFLKNFLKKGMRLLYAQIKDFFFKPDCLVYYSKIKGSFKDAYLKTVKATRLELEEEIANKIENEEFLNEFKSNQVFIYCHGIRVIGFNYSIYIIIYITIFAVEYNIYYSNEMLDAIYAQLVVFLLALIVFVATLSKVVRSSFSDIIKWTYLNTYRLYEQMEIAKKKKIKKQTL